MSVKRAVVLAIVALAACNPQPMRGVKAPAPTATASIPPIDIRGHGTSRVPVSIFERRGKRKIYDLTSKSLESHSAQAMAQATFSEATVNFYDADGTRLTARAPQASVDQRKQVVLSGGVHATTSAGASLDCRQLVYDEKSGLITGTGNVRMLMVQNGQTETFTGSRVTSNVKLTKIVLR